MQVVIGLVVVVMVVGVIWLLGWIPGSIAARKGRSFWVFFVFGLLFFLPTLIVALCLRGSVGVREGDLVKVGGKVTCADGTTIASGWTSKVVDVNVVRGAPAVQITGPSGSLHWVMKSKVRPA